MLRRTLVGLSISLLCVHGHAGVEPVEAALEAGDYQRALALLSDGAKAQDPAKQLLLGVALTGLGRYEDAGAVYQALISEWPAQPQAYNNLAALHARQGMLDEARELLEQALRTDPNYATVYDNLTRITVEISRSSYARALRLQGDADAMELVALRQMHPAEAQPVTVIQLAAAAQEEATATPATHAPTPTPPEPEPTAEPVSEPVAERVPPEPEPQPEPVPEPKPAPEAEPEPPRTEHTASARSHEVEAPVETEATKADIQAAMRQWAAYWSAQDVDGYLSAYSDAFVPVGNLSLSQWQAQRRDRLARPNRIEVALDEMAIELLEEGRARVRVNQAYDADHYSDLTRKEFHLQQEAGAWRIVTERTLEVLAQ